MSRKIANDKYGVRRAAKIAMDVPYAETDKLPGPDNVKGSFVTEHPEKLSVEPRPAKEPRRLASTPSASCEQRRGKSNDADGVLRFPKKTPSVVTTVDFNKNKGAAFRAAKRQIESPSGPSHTVTPNSNPKKRTT